MVFWEGEWVDWVTGISSTRLNKTVHAVSWSTIRFSFLELTWSWIPWCPTGLVPACSQIPFSVRSQARNQSCFYVYLQQKSAIGFCFWTCLFKNKIFVMLSFPVILDTHISKCSRKRNSLNLYNLYFSDWYSICVSQGTVYISSVIKCSDKSVLIWVQHSLSI